MIIYICVYRFIKKITKRIYPDFERIAKNMLRSLVPV